MFQLNYLSKSSEGKLLLPAALLGAAVTGYLVVKFGTVASIALLALPLLVVAVAAVFYRPAIGLMLLLILSFVAYFLYRHFPNVPFSLLTEFLLCITWLGVFFNRLPGLDHTLFRKDLCVMGLAWFGMSVLQAFNPADASLYGWLSEIRSTALLWFLMAPLCFIIFKGKKYLNLFLILIIGCSVVAALYGIKQLHLGLDMADQAFLDAGAAKTHLLWGKLRVFSLYSDAGQFGASQAQVGLISLILAFGPFHRPKRLLLLLAAAILFYGMLISGTRGSLFMLLVGVSVALLLSRKVKILILGSMIALSGLFVLKYTNIGNSSYHIYRLRTALNPQDPSLNLRFENQRILAQYLKDYPFGGGLGVIGYNGHLHNPDKFLSSIEPDSYWVKIWAMYGVVGLVIWLSFMLYMLGKCAGIVWNIRDDNLRQKLLALLAGAAGSFVCSYGNEVMNTMPSSVIFYASLAFIYMGPKLNKPSLTEATHA